MTFGENRGTTSAWSDSILMGTRAKQDFYPAPLSWISFLKGRRMEFASFVETHRLRARIDSRNEAAVLELTCCICEGNAFGHTDESERFVARRNLASWPCECSLRIACLGSCACCNFHNVDSIPVANMSESGPCPIPRKKSKNKNLRKWSKVNSIPEP